MKLIVGLGNPGKQYENTRHNIGWRVVDAIHAAHAFPAWSAKFKGMVSKGKIGGQDVVLLKPHTYMNLSGESVQPAVAFYKVALADVLAVHDELDLPFLALRHKVGGGDAGHNGLKSITAALGAGYGRLRVGIDRPARKEMVADYVLHPFTAAEAEQVARFTTAIAKDAALLVESPAALLDKLK
ncbi:MAG: aminoacyl-tRNA hydrolase [Alphaproteobacteria bacterium]